MYFVIFFTILFQSLALVFMKFAADDISQFSITNFMKNENIWFAILCLGFQSILWQLVLRKHNLSHAYYFMSLRYFFTLGFGYFLFNENISLLNIIGLLVIASGITLFALGKRDV